jgi:thioredoxin 1
MASFQEIINGSEPVLVDFFAEWCGPCKMLKPVLEEFASKNQGKIRVLKVDVDKNPQAAMAYKIMGVPTLILFKSGKPVWRTSGYLTINQLTQAIAPFTN